MYTQVHGTYIRYFKQYQAYVLFLHFNSHKYGIIATHGKQFLVKELLYRIQGNSAESSSPGGFGFSASPSLCSTCPVQNKIRLYLVLDDRGYPRLVSLAFLQGGYFYLNLLGCFFVCRSQRTDRFRISCIVITLSTRRNIYKTFSCFQVVNHMKQSVQLFVMV